MTNQTLEELEIPFEEEIPAPDTAPADGRRVVVGAAALSASKRSAYQTLGLELLTTALLNQKKETELPGMLDAWLTLAYEQQDMTEDADAIADLQTQIDAKVSRFGHLLEPLAEPEPEAEAEEAEPEPVSELVVDDELADGAIVEWTWSGDKEPSQGTVLAHIGGDDDEYSVQYGETKAEAAALARSLLTLVETPAGEMVVEGEVTAESEPEAEVPEPATVEAVPNPGPKAKPFETSTSIRYDPAAEATETGKYTINVHLLVMPSTGDGKQRQVIVNLTSHGMNPVMYNREVGVAVWNELPNLIADFQRTLPERITAEKFKPTPGKAGAAPSFGQPGHLPATRSEIKPAPKPAPKPKKGAAKTAAKPAAAKKTPPTPKPKAPPPKLFE